MAGGFVLKRVVVFGVVWLVSAVVTVGVLTAVAGVGKADPPWLRADGTIDESKLPDIWGVAGPEREIIGWVYSPRTPTPDWNPEQGERPEQSWWMYSPQTREWHPSEAPPYNVKRAIEIGGEPEVIVITALPSGVRFHPGPVFSTREEAEAYAATQRRVQAP